jgi:mannose PTS system EIIC component
MVLKAILAAGVGGLLSLDRFQVFQLMLSRPLVAGPVVGWTVGDVAAGFAAGLLFELLWLRDPPVGGHVPPDVTAASMALAGVCGIVRSETGVPLSALACLGFLLIVPLAFVGALLDESIRVQLGRLARGAELALIHGNDRQVYGYLAAGLGLGFVSQFVLLFPVILVGSFVLSAVVSLLPDKLLRAAGVAFYVIPLIGVGEIMVWLDGKEYVGFFVAGLLACIGAALIVSLCV